MWGVLLPITSRGVGGEGVQPLSDLIVALQGFLEGVLRTTAEAERSGGGIKVLVGIDEGDAVLDSEEGNAALTRAFGGELDFEIFRVKTSTPALKQPSGDVPDAPAEASSDEELPLSPSAAPRVHEGQVCRVWRKLAQEAFRQGAEYTVLLGDDVRLLSPGWMGQIKDEFKSLQRELSSQTSATTECLGPPFVDLLPLGFGVVCFTDERSPGFPGFPVLHRTHGEIFPEIFPEKFVNQDADPWIFEVYNRFGAARLSRTARLKNTLGGCEGDAAGRSSSTSSSSLPTQQRYRKVAVNWKSEMLGQGVQQARAWLESRPPLLQLSPEANICQGDGGRRLRRRFDRFVVLDVLVPTVRLDDLSILTAICSLVVPPHMRTMFIIIVDDPTIAPSRIRAMANELQRAARANIVRVRQNQENIGAGPSRNRALQESSADWGLFLDDDVKPNGDILAEYGRLIVNTVESVGCGGGGGGGEMVSATTGDGAKSDNHSHAASTATTTTTATCCGFIGMTKFPPAETPLLRAVALSDVTYMYGISGELSHPAWGVTANLLVRFSWPGKRRVITKFGDQFPKTGGGEDVDFCLRRVHTGGTFLPAPEAIVIHPWWPGGRFKTYRQGRVRFFRWSFGDGQLMDLHPQFSYRSYPNVAESMLLTPLYLTLLYLAPLAFGLFSRDGRGGDGGAAELSCSSGDFPSSPLSTVLALPLQQLALMLLMVLTAEMTCDVPRNTWGRRWSERLPSAGCFRRVMPAAEASCVITALEVGRLAGQWSRGGLGLQSIFCRGSGENMSGSAGAGGGIAGNFCRRFDWHCGRMAGAIESEKRRALLKLFVWHALLLLIMMWKRASS
ncbi:unnamed protein product [Ectocarpus sp. 13 AM-2016]